MTAAQYLTRLADRAAALVRRCRARIARVDSAIIPIPNE